MSLRLPTPPTDPRHQATCELILERLLRRCGQVVDELGLHDACDGDPAVVRYARDTLSLFASLGQVEHVRRNLWIIDDFPPSADPARREEFLRAAVACRALGAWSVIDGQWALVLDGLLDDEALEQGTRFVTTPRPARPGTFAAGRRADLRDRHATTVRDVQVTAVLRAADRPGAVSFLEFEGFGAHVRAPVPALLTIAEHGRVAGGHEQLRRAALALLVRAGALDALVAAAARHPSLAVRRRIARVILDARWPDRRERDLGWDEEDELWRIVRALDLQHGRRPSPMEAYRLPLGRVDRTCMLVENLDAPIAAPTRGPDGISIARQVRAERERRAQEAHERELAELRAIDARLEARWADRRSFLST